MPGTDGLAFLRLLKERLPSIDVVLMTAYEDVPTVVSAMQEGATDFLTKPLNQKAVRTGWTGYSGAFAHAGRMPLRRLRKRATTGKLRMEASRSTSWGGPRR